MEEEASQVDSDPSAPSNRRTFVHNDEAIWQHREPYSLPGFGGLFSNYYATLCAAFAALGGLVFGYDQVGSTAVLD